ncbi:LamG domain-containing protein [bacterium]|nr:LamG domain-containing protein [bacterium]MBU1958342.1 LamG domain-containing protein [bacterium]
MKKIYYLFLWIIASFTSSLQATSIPVLNGTFDCGCTDYAYCSATNWTHQNLNSAFAYCQTSAHVAGGGEVNGGDGFLILGDGTTTYQDIAVSQPGEYSVNYREAEHTAAAGTVYIEYLDASKNVLKSVSNDFIYPFVYVSEGGAGVLSNNKTLNGGTSPAGTAYVRIKFYGTKGTNGFAKVDDVSLSYQAPSTPACSAPVVTNANVWQDQSVAWTHNANDPTGTSSNHTLPSIDNNTLISSASNETLGGLTGSNTGHTNEVLYINSNAVPSSQSDSTYVQYSFTTQANLSEDHYLYGIGMAVYKYGASEWNYSGAYQVQVKIADNASFNSPTSLQTSPIQINHNSPTTGATATTVDNTYYFNHYDLENGYTLQHNTTYYVRVYPYNMTNTGKANGVTGKVIFDDFKLKTYNCNTTPPPPSGNTTCGLVTTSIMPSGNINDAGNSNRASVIAFDYEARGTVDTAPTPISLAMANEVGTVWGKAYNANNKKLYTSAFLRRHADLSPDGLGAIYEIDVANQTPTLWMNLNSTTHLGASATLFPNETAANRGLSSPFSPSHDVWAYSRVAKEGLGGLDLSDDFTKMYAMDLTNRQLLEIDTASKSVSNRYPITNPGCAGGAGDVRPFGVDYLNGEVYVGVTCSGETNKNDSDVDAYVMKLTGSSFTPVVSGAKGFTWAGYWDDDPYAYGSSCGNFKFGLKNAYVPLITNMEIDSSGNMIIGVTSRNGFRFAEGNYAADTACTSLITGHESRGFVLNAIPSGLNWVLNATETWNTDNGTEQHHYKDGIFAHWGSGASETYIGGMAVTSCSGEEVVITNLMDALDYETAGTRYIRTADAQQETAANIGDTDLATSTASTMELYRGMKTSWEKSAGLGDIEYLDAPSNITNLAEYRFDCLATDEYRDYSSLKNLLKTKKNGQPKPNSTLMCNAIDGYGSNMKIKHQAQYEIKNGSVSFWFYDAGTVSSTDDAFNKGAFSVGFQPVSGTTGKVRVTLANGSTITSNRTYDAATPEWIYVTLTFEENDKLKLYLDAVLEGEGAYDNSFNNNKDIYVAEFSGLFDEFYMFDGAMNQTQVQERYQGQLQNKNLNGSLRDCSCTPPPTSTMALFNVERTNSDTVDNATQERKEAFYTQIAGRDFNYAVVAYDTTATDTETPIEDITLKIDLLDNNDSTTENILYTEYIYFTAGDLKSRLPITPVDDLQIPNATRDARFRISFILDSNGSIVTGKYDNAVDYNATKILNGEDFAHARDNFAIRAESFYMAIADGNMTRKTNQDIDTSPLKLAAGYDYNLNVTALQYRADNVISPALNYNTIIPRTLTFKSSSSCNDTNNSISNEAFTNGENSSKSFSLANVGIYQLHLEDSQWTKVDSNKTIPDCTPNISINSADGNTLSGCNISTIKDMNLSSYPYQFNVSFNQRNLPSSGHDDFIYMSEISPTYNNVAIQFEGSVTAQNAMGASTSNFTSGCVGQNVLLKLDASTISEDGVNQALHTTKNTPVNFTRMLRFNNEPFASATYNTFSQLGNAITITPSRFLDENNGSTQLDIRYNIDKHLSQTINPIEITFNRFDSNSTASNSIANDKVNVVPIPHTPQGSQNLSSLVRNFYFTQVVPDSLEYPQIHFNDTQIIRTPLNVDIFCKINGSYCNDRKVLTNSNPNSSPRRDAGWYLSSFHDGQADGNVTVFNSIPNILTITPSTPVTFTTGRHGVIITEFDSCAGQQESTVTVTPQMALRYHPNAANNGLPEYKVSCTNQDPSEWSGVGQTGSILNIQPSSNKASKIDW